MGEHDRQPGSWRGYTAHFRHSRCPSYVFLGLALFLSGCGSVALKHSFENYSDTYAGTQNRQMLLNLARLSYREPIYFFQLTNINASYTFTGTAALGDIHERGLTNLTTPGAAEGPTTNFRQASATLGGTATQNPVFDLVPLGGDKFAAQLLAPIKPEIFYELFEEGWPVDLLMRVLIERIELVEPDTAHPKSPSAGNGEYLEIMVNDPLESESGHYDRFLRACALARMFQQKGILYLDISDSFEPLAANAVFPYPPTDDQLLNAERQNLVWKQVPDDKALIQPQDTPEKVSDTKSQGGGEREHPSAELTAGNWQLGKSTKQTLFKLNQEALVEAQSEIASNPEFAGNDNLMEKFQSVAVNGIGVADTVTAKGSYNVRLIMRSLLGAMVALANEQSNYDRFRVSESDLNPVPKFEDHPALMLNWPVTDSDHVYAFGSPAADAPVASLSYRSKFYSVEDRPDFVTDKSLRTDPSLATWNRDVFRLVVQLSFQVTADPSAFALPSLLQSH
jgi:hypothetical protein